MKGVVRLMLAWGLLACVNAHATLVGGPYESWDPASPAWANTANLQPIAPSADPFFTWLSGIAGPSGPQNVNQASRPPNKLPTQSVLPTGSIQVVPEFTQISAEANRPDLVIPIPEPATWLMVLAGCGMLIVVAWRRSRNR